MLYTYIYTINITYGKICFNKKKKDQAISKQFEKINTRTFPPSIFKLNSIIASIDIPDIIEPIIEPILLIEKQPETEKQFIAVLCKISL